MKVTYLGNFFPAFSTEQHYKQTLESLGHKVIALQESKASSDEVLNQALQSDMFVWSKTHPWETSGSLSMGEVLKRLRVKGIPSVAYHLDAFMFIPERWRYYRNHDYLKVEYFFTPDKQFAHWITANRSRGYYLPAGVFDQECKTVAITPDLQSVIFVGSKKYHPRWAYRPQLIDWLAKTYGSDFGLYGNDGLRVVRGMDLTSLYQSAKVIVGDSYCPNFNYPYFWSDRVYETTGRGGFIIHPMIKGLEDNFELGKELVTYDYSNTSQLKDLIDHYLANADEREAIRQAGMRRTLEDHTYKRRWEKILQIIK